MMTFTEKNESHFNQNHALDLMTDSFKIGSMPIFQEVNRNTPRYPKKGAWTQASLSPINAIHCEDLNGVCRAAAAEFMKKDIFWARV